MTTQMDATTIERTAERYMALPYRVELIPSVEGGYVVRLPDLPSCVSQGDTVEEAMEMIRDAQRGWIEVMLENGRPVPEPADAAGYSGKFTLRVPRRVHRALAEAAEAEGVSVNLFAASVLAMAVGERVPDAVAPGRQPPMRMVEDQAANDEDSAIIAPSL
jgi:antitoxin HicB